MGEAPVEMTMGSGGPLPVSTALEIRGRDKTVAIPPYSSLSFAES